MGLSTTVEVNLGEVNTTEEGRIEGEIGRKVVLLDLIRLSRRLPPSFFFFFSFKGGIDRETDEIVFRWRCRAEKPNHFIKGSIKVRDTCR